MLSGVEAMEVDAGGLGDLLKKRGWAFQVGALREQGLVTGQWFF